MALALQGSLLVRHAPAAVADAFCASRLAGEPGLALTLGTLHPSGEQTPTARCKHVGPQIPATRSACAPTRPCSTLAVLHRERRHGRVRPFTIPGHKQRTDLVGSVVAGDVPLFAGLETMKQAQGVLAEAERRAAVFWGADWCRFSVGGSTHGNQTLALAVGRPGDEVVVGRRCTARCSWARVAGLRPVWLRPAVDAALGLPGAVPVEAVEEALSRHPGAVAVVVGDPSYVGTTGDVRGLAAAAHAAGVPLVVDAAGAPISA